MTGSLQGTAHLAPATAGDDDRDPGVATCFRIDGDLPWIAQIAIADFHAPLAQLLQCLQADFAGDAGAILALQFGTGVGEPAGQLAVVGQ